MSDSVGTTQDTPISSSNDAENIPDTLLGRLYQAHIGFISAKNVDALLNQYADDAVLISSIQRAPRIYRGREELRRHLLDILAIEDIRVSVGFWGEVDDTLLMITERVQMTVDGQASSMRFADSWVLRNGKIAIHFAGMVQYTDGSLA